MTTQTKRFLLVLGVLGVTVFFQRDVVWGQSRFLTLPFSDLTVTIQQGWIYSSPGDFQCPPPEGDRCHRGIDYVKGIVDQPPWSSFNVLAAASGRGVVSSSTYYGTFGYIVHDVNDSSGSRYFTVYAHLRRSTVPATIRGRTLAELKADIERFDFTTWTPLSRGEFIGMAGDSGSPGVVHLHFEVQRGGYPLNKTDPYDVAGTRSFRYTHFGGCGEEFLWMQCPPTVGLLPPFTYDDFNDNFLDPARWSTLVPPPGFSVNVSETNQRLEVAVVSAGLGGGGIVSKCSLSGDFDVQVDYTLINWLAANRHSVRLGAADLGVGLGGGIGLNRSSFPNAALGTSEFYLLSTVNSTPQIAATDTTGMLRTLRLVRQGATLSGFVRIGATSVPVGSGAVSTIATRINLDVGGGDAAAPGGIKAALDNFKVNAGTVQCPSP